MCFVIFARIFVNMYQKSEGAKAGSGQQMTMEQKKKKKDASVLIYADPENLSLMNLNTCCAQEGGT